MKTRNTILLIGVLIMLGMVVIQRMPKKETAHAQDEHHHENAALDVNKTSQALIGLQTMKAKRSRFIEKIFVAGQIAQEVEKNTYVSSSKPGTITQCTIEMGAVVKEGDALCRVMPDNATDSMQEVTAPVKGVVISDFAKVGDRVDTMTPVHTIADFSTLWATFDVYEKDMAKVKVGQTIIVHSGAYPDTPFKGTIVFVSPRVDERSNTIKIRARISNNDCLLKLGMFVTGDICIPSAKQYVVVPLEAIQSIGDTKVVFLQTGEHAFVEREITVQKENATEAAIQGITEGEIIVTQNGFLLKSELLKSKMGEGCAE